MKKWMIVPVLVLLLGSGLAWAHTYQSQMVIDAEAGARNSVSIGRESIGLAYDSMGNVGMCYQDDTNDDLKYGLYDGNAWTMETAHADRDGDVVGANCAIIFDDDDNPHIVYHNVTDRDLLHAYKRNGRWNIVTIDDNAGIEFFGASRVSIAKDGLGFIAVAYYDASNRDLKYAKQAGERWAVTTVQNVGDVGRYASLAFDSRNRPAIAYQDFVDNAHASLKYIVHDGNAWGQPETVDGQQAAGSFANLKFDANNKPHIAYRYYSAEERFYAVYYINKVSGRWGQRLDLALQSGPATGQYLQMTIDDFGNVHIIYEDQFLSALFPDVNYLKVSSLFFVDRGYDAMAETTQFVTSSGLPQLDYAGSAIAIDSNSNLLVAWAQESGRNYDLMTARITRWSPVISLLTPNSVSNSGQNNFELQWLDFDPDSNAHIRFSRRDANFNAVAFDGVVRENDANTHSIDLSNVPRGEYFIVVEISDDADFNLASSMWSREKLTVQNHPPSLPVLSSPAHQGSVNSATPTLQWAASNDGDNDAITYQVQVATDDGFANIIASGDADNVSWVPGVNLGDGVTHYWRVRARDAEGVNSNWAVARSFGVAIPAVVQAPADAGGRGGAAADAGGGGRAAPADAGARAAAPGPVDIGGHNVDQGGGNARAGAAGGAAAGAGNNNGMGNAGAVGAAAGAGNAGAAAGAAAANADAAPKSGGCSLIR